MIKIIETNLSLDNNDNIADHQSRVIEIESWDSYVNEIKEGKCVDRNCCISSLHGSTIQSDSRIENLIFDNYHLSCDVYNRHNLKTKKLAYLV